MQVTQIGSNVTLERCDVQTVTNVNCQYQNEDFKTDTGDKTGEYVVAQENCDLNRNNGGNGEEVNTKEVAQQITAELKRYSIPQAIFAQRVLCRSQVIFRFSSKIFDHFELHKNDNFRVHYQICCGIQSRGVN